jgi:hypothetical protein
MEPARSAGNISQGDYVFSAARGRCCIGIETTEIPAPTRSVRRLVILLLLLCFALFEGMIGRHAAAAEVPDASGSETRPDSAVLSADLGPFSAAVVPGDWRDTIPTPGGERRIWEDPRRIPAVREPANRGALPRYGRRIPGGPDGVEAGSALHLYDFLRSYRI